MMKCVIPTMTKTTAERAGRSTRRAGCPLISSATAKIGRPIGIDSVVA
jgi:hypothetical protein